MHRWRGIRKRHFITLIISLLHNCYKFVDRRNISCYNAKRQQCLLLFFLVEILGNSVWIWEDIVKNRLISAISVACAGCLIFSFCYSSKQMQAQGLTAGIVASAAVNVEEAAAMPQVSDADVATTGTAQLDTFGYTNLGLANVEGNINIREAASTDASMVGKLPENAGCEILGTEGDWTHISSGEVEGYVLSEYLLTGDAAITKANEVARYTATVNTDSLRVRLEPNTTSEILATMPEGEELEIVSETDGWVQVNIDGEYGYVSGDYVTCATTLADAMTMSEARYGQGVSDVRVDLVNYATQFVGNPYVWGGTSLTNGADCSGFVLSVFAKYGYSLPHSSRAQANYGTRVSTSELMPGDLVFYGSGKSISHVAIYIGGGQIVHASTERTGIIISSAFNRSPICCTRLLD